MDINTLIYFVELKFKKILEEFFVSNYSENNLSSHGIEHHRRVWIYAKKIILLHSDNHNRFSTEFLSRLIIACYLHDIGMSVDPGIKHGHHSRVLCTTFLEHYNLPLNDFDEVLNAIENHDQKEYKVDSEPDELLQILSVADDLDAFGFIGIYRYLDIYLIRNIEFENICILIKNNSASRFAHFEQKYYMFEDFFKEQKQRFEVLIEFLDQYNCQVHSYQFATKTPGGYCGILEILNNIKNNSMDLDTLLNNYPDYKYDKTIQWFIEGLKNELSS